MSEWTDWREELAFFGDLGRDTGVMLALMSQGFLLFVKEFGRICSIVSFLVSPAQVFRHR